MGDESVARRQGFATKGEEVTREMAETAARAAAEMFGKDVTIIDLRESSPTRTTSWSPAPRPTGRRAGSPRRS